jgi:hypothetical protein
VKTPDSVRPPLPRISKFSGLGKVGAKVDCRGAMPEATRVRAVFPVQESDEPGSVEPIVGEEQLVAVEEEEDVVCPPSTNAK